MSDEQINSNSKFASMSLLFCLKGIGLMDFQSYFVNGFCCIHWHSTGKSYDRYFAKIYFFDHSEQLILLTNLLFSCIA